jgi:hypothetical protein
VNLNFATSKSSLFQAPSLHLFAGRVIPSSQLSTHCRSPLFVTRILVMVRQRRPRSEAEKAHRRAIDRLGSLQKKVDEFNTKTKGRIGIVWEYKGETASFGDRQLLDSIRSVRTHHQSRLPIRSCTFSPTDSNSSTSSPEEDPWTPPENFSVEEEEILDLDSLQHEPPPASLAHTPKITARWKKEDLNLLAVDFFDCGQ